jgi:predicted RNA-binding protein with PUA-like domain
MKFAYWLMKSEPSTYCLQDLQRDQKTNWNGIRNYQARNYLKTCQPGDLVLVYHSGKERAVVGVAEVISSPYPDTQGDETWVQVDLKYVSSFKKAVPLSRLKEEPALNDLMLFKQTRLSVMPLTQKNYEIIIKLGK